MRKIRCPFVLLLSVAIGFIPMSALARKQPARDSQAGLIQGLGELHHPVSTQNSHAQAFFDQGLKQVYGFNHRGAQKSFERAAELDPNLAMAWWGVALALGPNYNFPVEPEKEKAAYDAIQKAISLQDNGSEAERAYINALAFRYSNDPKVDYKQLDIAYRGAMAKLTNRYPDDLDAATLYAGSIMNLNPWKLWSHEGRPAEGTEEILAVLESVLKRDPNHIGANHYYIHAIEASPYPERGLACAERMEKLAPGAGHLTHMPAHIYSRTGDQAGSVRANVNAVAVDRRVLSGIKDPGVENAMLAVHNIHFLAFAYCMDGNFSKAKAAAEDLVAHVQPYIKEMQMLEGFLPTSYLVLLTFERWNEILRTRAPDEALTVTTAEWRFVRTVALAKLGKPELAEQEKQEWQKAAAKVPPDTFIIELNTAGPVFKVHENLLNAAIAQSRHDDKGRIEFLKQAVAAQDALNYCEPPSFYPPVRALLGRALLDTKQFGEAEKVFRTSLEKNPRYRVALAGLRDSLNAQNRQTEAGLVDQQLRGLETAETETPKRRR